MFRLGEREPSLFELSDALILAKGNSENNAVRAAPGGVRQTSAVAGSLLRGSRITATN